MEIVNVDVNLIVVVCDVCGWKGERGELVEDQTPWMSIPPAIPKLLCPECGNNEFSEL